MPRSDLESSIGLLGIGLCSRASTGVCPMQSDCLELIVDIAMKDADQK
jgi:hypothetical protein